MVYMVLHGKIHQAEKAKEVAAEAKAVVEVMAVEEKARVLLLLPLLHLLPQMVKKEKEKEKEKAIPNEKETTKRTTHPESKREKIKVREIFIPKE